MNVNVGNRSSYEGLTRRKRSKPNADTFINIEITRDGISCELDIVSHSKLFHLSPERFRLRLDKLGI
jgi:hypothetical protein